MDNWWVACVTFERRDEHHTEFLPDHCQGAVGWMAVFTTDNESIRDMLEASLAEVSLRLLQIEDATPAGSFDHVQCLDSHLAMNLVGLEPGKSVVWGTIHTYIGDGEA
jgi:hypothetical protein